jgi:hypothetical protein
MYLCTCNLHYFVLGVFGSKQVVIDLSSSEAVFREGKEGGETEVMSIVCTRGSSKTAG